MFGGHMARVIGRGVAIAFVVLVCGCTQRGLQTIQNTYAAEPYVANFNNLNKLHEELDKLERALQESQVPKAQQYVSASSGDKPEKGKGSNGDSWFTGWWPFSPSIKEVEDTYEVKCVGFDTTDNKIVWRGAYDDNGKPIQTASDCSNVGQIPPKILVAYMRGRSEEADGYCQAFFTGLDKLSSSTRYARDTTNDTFELATVILGLTQAAAHQLAILAGAQTFISGQFDSFERFMLLAPEPYRIHKFVQAKQREFRENGSNNIEAIATFDRAQRWVRDYANFCTMKGIKQIVDEAISNQQVAIERGDVQDQVQRSERRLLEINRVLTGVVRKTIKMTHLDVIPTYWFFKLRSEAAPDGKTLDKKGEAKTAASKLGTELKALAAWMVKDEVQEADSEPSKPADDASEEEKDKYVLRKKLFDDFNIVRSLVTEYGAFLSNPYNPGGKTIAAEAEDARDAYYSDKPVAEKPGEPTPPTNGSQTPTGQP